MDITDNPSRPLTAAEAGALLGGLTAKTLAQWRWLGQGPRYLKVGGSIRYLRADLEEWLQTRTVDPGQRRGA